MKKEKEEEKEAVDSTESTYYKYYILKGILNEGENKIHGKLLDKINEYLKTGHSSDIIIADGIINDNINKIKEIINKNFKIEL